MKKNENAAILAEHKTWIADRMYPYDYAPPTETVWYCALCGARLGAQNPHDVCDTCATAPKVR